MKSLLWTWLSSFYELLFSPRYQASLSLRREKDLSDTLSFLVWCSHVNCPSTENSWPYVCLFHLMLSALTCRVCFPFPSINFESIWCSQHKCVLRMGPSCCSSFHPSGLLTLMLELTNHAALHLSSYSSSVLNQESQLSSLCALCSFTATRANLGWNTFSPYLLFPVLILFAVLFVLVHTQHCRVPLYLGLPSAGFAFLLPGSLCLTHLPSIVSKWLFTFIAIFLQTVPNTSTLPTNSNISCEELESRLRK